MIKMDNGALLALGLVGVVAAAGRMKRGSFARPALLQQIEQIYEASDSDQEVDSNELTYVLYNASESDEVPTSLRHEADELLARSEEEQYIDTGEALELLGRIRDAMRSVAQRKHAARKGGSRAVGVNANSAKSRAEYVAYLDDLTARAKAGNLTLDENARWSFGADPTPYDPPNVNRKLITQAILKNIATERAWISTWPQRNPGAGSKAVYGMSPTDAGHVLRVGGAQPKIRSNAGEALNDYRWHPDRALAELEAARGKGKGGSRARKIHDDREYTHYVVHGPTMKILSGWSFPEDAWEEIKENLGTAGKDCKVYTRRHLTRSGFEPRENTNWGGAALHQSLFRT